MHKIKIKHNTRTQDTLRRSIFLTYLLSTIMTRSLSVYNLHSCTVYFLS